MLSSSSESDSSPQSPLPQAADLWRDTFHWQPTLQQTQQFQQLYELVLAGNRQFNLTRITNPPEFLEKHLWDSLSGIKPWLISAPAIAPNAQSPNPFRVLDIGTGAGFPGLPIAIARPDWHLTLADSTRKKIAFLEHSIALLHLAQVDALWGRAEELGQQATHRHRYNLVTIRAVAAATICAEYALPFLAPNGQAVLYRGHWSAAEETALAQAAQILGGEIETIAAFQTPLTHSDRHCIYLRKTGPTPPDYPRAIGIPTQQPLP